MEEDETEQWDQINNKAWRGLGLTDPIKNVEVCMCVTVLSLEPLT